MSIAILTLTNVKDSEIIPMLSTGCKLSKAPKDKNPMSINAKISRKGFGKWVVYCGSTTAVEVINSKFEGRLV
jgi:hypothetical protein